MGGKEERRERQTLGLFEFLKKAGFHAKRKSFAISGCKQIFGHSKIYLHDLSPTFLPS